MKKSLLTFGLIFCLLLVAYAAVLLPYVYHDEFSFLEQKSGLFWHPYSVSSAMRGRPGSSVFLSMCGFCVNRLDHVRFIRLFSVFLLALSAYLFLPFFDRFSGSRKHSIAFSIIVMTLPSFAILASWAGVSPFPLAMVVSLIAARSVVSFSKKRPGWGQDIQKCVLAGGLFFLSNMIYPSVASVYWVAVAIVWFDEFDWDRIRPSRASWIMVAAGFLGYVLYWASLQFTHFAGDHIFNNLARNINTVYDPYHISVDVVGKIIWFVKEPLFYALNFWDIFPGKVLPVVFCAIVVSAWVKGAYEAQSKTVYIKRSFLGIVMGAAFCALSFLPNLMARADVAFYRCLGGIVLLVSLLGFLALRRLLPGRYVFKCLCFFVCIGVSASLTTIYRYRAAPSLLENHFLSKIMFSVFDRDVRQMCFVFPQRRALQDEFGTITLDFIDDWPHIITAYFREYFPRRLYHFSKTQRVTFNVITHDLYYRTRGSSVEDSYHMGFLAVKEVPKGFDGVVINPNELEWIKE